MINNEHKYEEQSSRMTEKFLYLVSYTFEQPHVGVRRH